MRLVDFSVKRPVATLMMNLVIVAVGLFAVYQLKMDLIPDVKYPTLTVVTAYAGASPEDVEKQVTDLVESVVSTVSDLKEIKSTSSKGMSAIQLEFNWGTDMGEAANEVRDRLDRIRDYLPEDADEPMILKLDISQMPAIVFSLSSDIGRDQQEMRRIAEDIIKPYFESIDGVASANVLGAWPLEYKILVDRERIIAQRISLDKLMMKLLYENLDVSGGFIKRGDREIIVRSIGEFKTPEEIESMVIDVKADGSVIHLGDIADVVFEQQEERGSGLTSGRRSLAVMITKQGEANTVDVVDRINERLPDLMRRIPGDVQILTVYDSAVDIKKSIKNTVWAAIEGALLAFVIVFIFLRNIRPTLVVSIAIPTSLLAGLAALFFRDMTLNIMTLGGLTIAIGRLVDDAIVVTENTYRHLSLGENRKDAAVKGASEVWGAVTSSTIVTVIVFAPLFIVKGITGEFFRPFAYAIIVSMFASLFVALTITPMVSSKLFSAHRAKRMEWGWFIRLREWYGSILAKALQHKWKVLVGLMVLFFVSILLLIPLKKNFMPEFDMDMVFLNLKMPPGTSVDITKDVTMELNDFIMKEPGVDMVYTHYGEYSTGRMGSQAASEGQTSGPNTGFIMIKLKPKGERDCSYDQILERIRNRAKRIPDLSLEVVDIASSMMGGVYPVDIRLSGFDLDKLEHYSKLVEENMNKTEGLVDVDNSMKKGSPEFRIHYDRERLSRYGLTVGQVATTVRTAIEGSIVSRIHRGGEEYDIRLRFREEDRKTLEDIENIPIVSPLGFVVLLKDVADVEEAFGPEKIIHHNKRRVAKLTGALSGRSLNEVISDLKEKNREIEEKFETGYLLEYGGEYEKMLETFSNLGFVLVVAMILVYMIMATQFESLTQPLSIMFSIPFAFTGSILFLFIFGQSLNITSFIGLIFLVGIVVTNAIVLVDFVNQLRRDKKHSIDDALVEAGKIRLRPILMTAFATIFAMIPMALALREGQEMEQGMAIAVIGGLFTSTILTLIIVPIAYKILEGWSERVRGRARKALHGEEDSVFE
ncbi:MAG: hypothetical protein DRH51_00685 [Candidatus Coatesbacteria bacterium]|nr:MAG: hypothetical protein DRH51_00685 [Candidatus Coatesbacteria bacterium]RLC43855.1 MAG: hypothetical protein DRH44_04125 [Candidatus Coatesbacteria bacterium]